MSKPLNKFVKQAQFPYLPLHIFAIILKRNCFNRIYDNINTKMKPFNGNEKVALSV